MAYEMAGLDRRYDRVRDDSSRVLFKVWGLGSAGLGKGQGRQGRDLHALGQKSAVQRVRGLGVLSRRALPWYAGAAFALLASPAYADPCEAPVRGYKAGQSFAGQVRYVGDADSICVGPTSDPRTWIEVRLADFYGPELSAPGGGKAKEIMARMALSKYAVCSVRTSDRGDRRTYSYDRVLAVCRVGGVSLGDRMRQAGVKEGGNGR